MDNYYAQHCENLRILESAIRAFQRTLRECISLNEERGAFFLTKILSHLVNSWVEVRLAKLVYEVGAFNDSQKKRIIVGDNLEEKWRKALNIAFCKAFKIKNSKHIDTQTTIPYSARTQHKALLSIIKTDLLESNSIRNRIAHGQWKFAFNNDMLRINGNLTRMLREENILKVQFRLAMFKSLAQIIHDLAVSKPTFERDFDANYKKIEEQRRNSQSVDYESYRRRMIAKKRQGLMKKNAAQIQAGN